MLGPHGHPSRLDRLRVQAGTRSVRVPRPRVAEPQGGQEVQRRRLRPAIGHRDADENVVDGRLGVLHLHVEVPVFVEDPGVEQLELRLSAPAPRVLLEQALVREFRLRVLVEGLHVGVGGRPVQVEVQLLDVLAVIALGTGEAEEALLENGIALVPQREGEAEALVVVAQAQQAVLAPPVGARAGVVVGKVVPGVAVGRIVLAHRPPLAIGEIGAPAAPVRRACACLRESLRFFRHRVLPTVAPSAELPYHRPQVRSAPGRIGTESKRTGAGP